VAKRLEYLILFSPVPVIQFCQTLLLKSGLSHLKKATFRRKVMKLQETLSIDAFYHQLLSRLTPSQMIRRGTTPCSPSSLFAPIIFFHLQANRKKQQSTKESLQLASELHHHHLLRLALRSFQFNISHNKFNKISVRSPQQLLISSIYGSHSISLRAKTISSTLKTILSKISLTRTIPSSPHSLDSSLKRYHKPSSSAWHWISKWHNFTQRRILSRLWSHFGCGYYRYRSWYHWRSVFSQKKRSSREQQQQAMRRGISHYRQRTLPHSWFLWKKSTRILLEQNRICFYFLTNTAMRKMRERSRRFSRIRLLLIQGEVQRAVSQLMLAMRWWKRWKRRKQKMREMRMIRSYLQSENNEDESRWWSVSSDTKRKEMKKVMFESWKSYVESRRAIGSWAGHSFEQTILREVWDRWRDVMESRMNGEDQQEREVKEDTQSVREHEIDFAPESEEHSTFGAETILEESEASRSSETEEAFVPVASTAFVFSLPTNSHLSSRSSLSSIKFKRSETPKGPRLSLHELSVGTSPVRTPFISSIIQQRSRSSISANRRSYQEHNLSPSELRNNFLLSPTQGLITLTRDSPNTLPRRGYLPRYEYLQHWKATHLRHRPSSSSFDTTFGATK
jgi:hypothetical protein